MVEKNETDRLKVDSSVSSDDKADTSLNVNSIARKALFAAVEESNKMEDTKEEEYKPYYCESLISLFEPSSKCNGLLPGVSSVRQQQSLINETIQSFHKSHARRFFSALKSIVEIIKSEESYVPESAFQDEEGDEQIDCKKIIPDTKSTQCLHFLKYAAKCVEIFLEGRRKAHQNQQTRLSKTKAVLQPLSIIVHVYDVALDLHNILFSLQSCGPDGLITQGAILNLCESWWHANALNRETLIVQCLPVLVLQALDGEKFQKTQVKRLFQLREAFQVIDFTNPSSDSLRSSLLRITSNPLCLRMNEGKKLLAALFQDESLVSDLHLAIRAQIPDARKTVLQAYGEIYLNAWKDASDATDGVRDAIEHQAIQDLMHAAIHVSSSVMAKSILTVLEPIHSAKKSLEIEGLLYRLYSPIIWRSLRAANPRVRINSITVLSRVFPLQDTSHTQTQAAVSKCSEGLRSALQDPDTRVRIAGSEATARVCAMFWDVLSASDIRMLLNHIVLEHASDVTSSAVRASALDAATVLLETKQSHAVLRPLLPSLGNLIHDKAEKVRMAAARMLQRVKQVPGIRFYHVVPVNHLTARLSEESRLRNGIHRNPVASQLTALMMNSYFPQGPNISGADQLKRALTFLLTEPDAAAVFYANVADHLPVAAVDKLIMMLCSCLKSAVDTEQARPIKTGSKTRKKRRRKDSDDQEPEEERGEQLTLSAANTPLMASLAEAIGALWESLESQITGKESHESREGKLSSPQNFLQNFSGAEIAKVLAHFEQKAARHSGQSDEESCQRDDCFRTCIALLRCAGRLPPDKVDGMIPHLSANLFSLSNEEMLTSRQHISAYFALLCLWGKTEEVASSLASSIESVFDDDFSLGSPCFDELDNSTERRRTSSRHRHRRSSSALVVPTIVPRIAWGVIDDMLEGSDPSSVTIRESILLSAVASNAIESALERGTSYAERLLLADSGLGQSFRTSEVEFVLCACEAYGRFALHKEANRNDGIGISGQARMLLEWTTEKVIPALKSAQSGETELRDLDLSRISNVSDSLILPGSPSSTLSPPRRRSNTRRTPTRLDANSASLYDQPLNEPKIFLVSAVAGSLLQSSCTIFSEWLAVGGSEADEIADAAVKWCRIFENKEDKDTDHEALTELIPAFTRLAVQLCKCSQNYLLLKRLLINCNDVTADAFVSSIRKSLASLFANRTAQGSKLFEGVIEAVLDSAYELIDSDAAETTALELPSTVDELWNEDKGCITSALSAIFSNRQASASLSRTLVTNLGSNCSGTALERRMFEIRCLWLLFQNSKKDSMDLRKLVLELDVEAFKTCTVVRDAVEKLQECAMAS